MKGFRSVRSILYLSSAHVQLLYCIRYCIYEADIICIILMAQGQILSPCCNTWVCNTSETAAHAWSSNLQVCMTAGRSWVQCDSVWSLILMGANCLHGTPLLKYSIMYQGKVCGLLRCFMSILMLNSRTFTPFSTFTISFCSSSSVGTFPFFGTCNDAVLRASRKFLQR